MILADADTSFLLLFPAIGLLLLSAIVGLAGFLAWDYRRDRRRYR